MIATKAHLTNGPDLQSNLRAAVRVLKKGGLVVFPTETVYGLAVDPTKKVAVCRLHRLKGRHDSKHLTLQVHATSRARKLVRKNILFEKLARDCWPGPLTLIAQAKKGGANVGIRIPRHTFALKLLRAYNKPLAVTSVNRSGERELWRKKELIEFLSGKVELIFWQRTRPRSSSTVVDVSGKEPRVLRPGPITKRQVMRITRTRRA